MTSLSVAQGEEIATPEVCSLVRGIKRAGSPWHLIVAAYLLDGPRRFNQILAMGKSGSLNSRTLSRALRHMVDSGFVRRKVLDTQPFAVEYSLTPQGERLRALLQAYRDLDPRIEA
ncbi:MAG: helix-turn-helix transcriptional regulator [archaeon]|nr:MAG: helix-turn-helix transcriptional regulator [archaeon]